MINVTISTKDYSEDFINFLSTIFLDIYNVLVDKNKLILLEVYINAEYKNNLKKYFSVDEICKIALSNVKIDTINENRYFHLDTTMKFPGTSISLNELCKVINYGNLSIKGYPIFTEINNYLMKHIDYYYDCFKGL